MPITCSPSLVVCQGCGIKFPLELSRYSTLLLSVTHRSPLILRRSPLKTWLFPGNALRSKYTPFHRARPPLPPIQSAPSDVTRIAVTRLEGRLCTSFAENVKRCTLPSGRRRYRPFLDVPNHRSPSGVCAIAHTILRSSSGNCGVSNRLKARCLASRTPTPPLSKPTHTASSVSTAKAHTKLFVSPSSIRQMR